MKITLKVWRQDNAAAAGSLVDYHLDDVSPDMSFLEMLDVLNEALIEKGEEPIAFDHDCREGICGTCSLMINGVPHGPDRGTAVCQLHMRRFKDIKPQVRWPMICGDSSIAMQSPRDESDRWVS